MKKIVLLVLIVFSFSGCEKDDICDSATSTTPRLIIEFYDISNPTVLKNVVNLKVIGDGMTDSLDTFNNVSKIELPLQTTVDLTKYTMVMNSTSTTSSNEDKITINYARKNVYVSRACGYKTVFTLNATDPIIYDDATTPDGFWIQDLDIVTPNVETENETHVKIYF